MKKLKEFLFTASIYILCTVVLFGSFEWDFIVSNDWLFVPIVILSCIISFTIADFIFNPERLKK